MAADITLNLYAGMLDPNYGSNCLRQSRNSTAANSRQENALYEAWRSHYHLLSRARSRLKAALIKVRCVKACGKFPKASPLWPVSSA